MTNDTLTAAPTDAPLPSTPRRRGRRILAWFTGVLVLLLAVTFVGAGWYYSDQLLPVPTFPRLPEVAVGRVDAAGGVTSSIVLPTDERYPDEGQWGVWWPAGYGQISNGRTEAPWTTWDFVQTVGDRVPAATDVLVERTAYNSGPRDAFGMAFSEVTFDGPLGSYAAWDIPGEDDTTWAILTHGRGATRRETLRMVGVLKDTGVHQLAITIRNHAGAPATDDGLGRFGTTEWEDLAAGVDHARRNGAQRIVLVGFSQGGAITLSYLENSLERGDDTSDIVGVVLDAPLVSLDASMVQAAGELGVPDALLTPLLSAARLVSRLRAGIDFDEVEHTNLIGGLTTPILVLSGDNDADVPVASVRTFAAARPDLIRYEEFPRAGHVESWNYERERYTDAVLTFLGSVLGSVPR